MSKQRMLVEWSPHDASLFAVGAGDLRLLETTAVDLDFAAPAAARHHPQSPMPPTPTTTQRKHAFRLLKINAQVTQLKSMQWYPFDAKPLWIAAGMGSGKVLLSDFQDPRARVVREFAPKYNRPCNAVAWNHSLPNQLAAGFEKVRSDYCTLVWDVSAGAGMSGMNMGMGMGSSPGVDGLGSTTLSSSRAQDERLADVYGESHLDDDRANASVRGAMNLSANGASTSVGSGAASAANALRGGYSGRNTDSMGAHDKPVYELGNSEATVALSWVPLQPTCLAVGTGFKWLRIYDLRSNGNSPMSVVAHSKAVLGVTFDNHRPYILATYTDAPQETVKVWDIRRLDTNLGPLACIHPSSKTLAQVSWCPTKPGILVTASLEERWLSLWDVTKQDTATTNNGDSANATMQIKKPFRKRFTCDALTSFSWQHVRPAQKSRSTMKSPGLSPMSDTRLMSVAFPNRLLTASVSGTIEDISVHDAMPTSISPNSMLAFSCGRLMFCGTTLHSARGRHHTSDEEIDEDISVEMRQLAKAGYSMELAKNLQLFAHPFASSRHRQLLHLWQWVDQVEALRRIHASNVAQARALASSAASSSGVANGVGRSAVGALHGWPIDALALAMVGVKSMLVMTSDSMNSTSEALSPPASTAIMSNVRTDPALGCTFYEGFGRRLAMLACAWDPSCGQSELSEAPRSGGTSLPRTNSAAWTPSNKQTEDSTAFGSRSSAENRHYELRSILSKCESESNYARAAALAVFHGDLASAVAILQRGSTWLSQIQNLNVAVATPYSSDLLQLVGMAIAGFSSAHSTPSAQSLWLNMCRQLLKREELRTDLAPRYLHAALTFLYEISKAASAASPPNVRLTLSPVTSSRRSGGARRAYGSVEALSQLGSAKTPAKAPLYSAILDDESLPLRDRVAFACRYLPSDALSTFITHHDEACQERGRLEGILMTGLNDQGIALLQRYLDQTGDVQTLALLSARLPSLNIDAHCVRWISIYQDLLNQWQLFHERARMDVQRAQLDDFLNNFASIVREPDGDNSPPDISTPAALAVAPQLYVRCYYCNNSLSLANLLRLGGSHSSWLNRAKPKLSCCPSCRKPLPQCALCLLPLGALNPYLELAHHRSRQTADAVAAAVAVADSGDTDAVLDDPAALTKLEGESLARLSSIPFVEWFTWCQSCKHGGHAHHIADWFSTHQVCPVTDCECMCRHLDLPLAMHRKQLEMEQKQPQQQAPSHLGESSGPVRQDARARGMNSAGSRARAQQSPFVQSRASRGGLHPTPSPPLSARLAPSSSMTRTVGSMSTPYMSGASFAYVANSSGEFGEPNDGSPAMAALSLSQHPLESDQPPFPYM